MTSATPASFGTNVSVTSWIWVTDWNSEMARPMARLVIRMGALTLAVTVIIRKAISMTAVSVIYSVLVLGVVGSEPVRRWGLAYSVEARDQGLDDEGPTVDQHEQQDLERE